MKKSARDDYEVIRRFLIVEANNRGLDNLERSKMLLDLQTKLSVDERKAVAEVIRSGLYPSESIYHDIICWIYHPEGFAPRTGMLWLAFKRD